MHKLPIIRLAIWIADLAEPTAGPREQKPCLSGGVTEINAQSISTCFNRYKRGNSETEIGMKSALPELIASRQYESTS